MKKIAIYSFILIGVFAQAQFVFAANDTCECTMLWGDTNCEDKAETFLFVQGKTREEVLSSLSSLGGVCNTYTFNSAVVFNDSTVIEDEGVCVGTTYSSPLIGTDGSGSSISVSPTVTCVAKDSTASAPAPSTFQPPSSTPLINPLSGNMSAESIPDFVGNIIERVLGILGSISLVVFMYGAFKWITSEGESDDIAEGTHTMAYAAIGILVIFASYGILQSVIGGITGG